MMQRRWRKRRKRRNAAGWQWQMSAGADRALSDGSLSASGPQGHFSSRTPFLICLHLSPFQISWPDFLSFPLSLIERQFWHQNVHSVFPFSPSYTHSVHGDTSPHQLRPRNTTNNVTVVVNNLGDRLTKGFIALALTYLKCQPPCARPGDLRWHPPAD